MPTLVVVLIAITSATSKAPQIATLAQVRDMQTCKMLEVMLNDYTRDDSDLVFMCREVTVARS